MNGPSRQRFFFTCNMLSVKYCAVFFRRVRGGEVVTYTKNLNASNHYAVNSLKVY